MSKIVVIGDLMLDESLHSNVERISPEAPIPISKVYKVSHTPGGCANVAVNLKSLGSEVYLFGAIGNDESKNILIKDLIGRGIHFINSHTSNCTTKKIRVFCNHQQISRIDFDPNINSVKLKFSKKLFIKYIKNIDPEIIIISDYNKGVILNIPSINEIKYHLPKVKILVDPKNNDWKFYTDCYLIKPNLKEFTSAFGQYNNENELEILAKNVCRRFSIDYILLTRSEEGMTLYNKNGKVIHEDAKEKGVIDVTGAGDSVISTIAHFLSKKYAIEKSIYLANIAASIVVKRIGTASVSSLDLDLFLKINRDYP